MSHSRDMVAHSFVMFVAGGLMQAMGERGITADQLDAAMGWPKGRLEEWLISVISNNDAVRDLTLKDLAGLAYELDVSLRIGWRTRPEPSPPPAPETPPEATAQCAL